MKTRTPNTTQRIANLLNTFIFYNTNPPPYVPTLKNVSILDLFTSRDAYDPAFFGKIMANLSRLALKSDSHMARISIGGVKLISVLDPDIQKEILEEYADCIDTKESIELFKVHFENAIMALASDDPKWRPKRNEIKRPVSELVNDPQILIDIAKERIKFLMDNHTTELDLVEEAHRFTTEVILKGMVGIKKKIDPEIIRVINAKLDDGIAKAVRLNSIALISLPEIIPPLRRVRVKLPSQVILKEGEAILSQLLEDNKKDIFAEGNDNWTTRKTSSLEACDQPNAKISRAELVNDLSFLFTAGSETSGNHIAFTIASIISNPKVLEKVMAEINELGDYNKWNTKTFENAKLSYTKMAIAESLRLFPPLPYKKMRVKKSFTLSNGVVIEAGEHIVFNTRATQRLEKIYKNANEFNPERQEFIGHTLRNLISQKNKKKCEFDPFGTDERSCPGAPLATMECLIFIVHYLRAYNLRLLKQWKPDEDIVETFGAKPRLGHIGMQCRI